MTPEALAVFHELQAARDREAAAYELQAAADRLRGMLETLPASGGGPLTRDELVEAADVLRRAAGRESSAGMTHRAIAGTMPGFAEYHQQHEADLAAFLLLPNGNLLQLETSRGT